MRMRWVLTLVLLVLVEQNVWSQPALPQGFARLRDFAPSIRQDIRYATRFNFTGQIVPGYDRAECIVWQRAAIALAKAESQLAKQGFHLKVYDCYRPLRAVRAFAAWSQSPGNTAMKSIFYPGRDKSKLFAQGFISMHSRHAMGIAVDLGLVHADEETRTPTAAGRCDGPFEHRAEESSLDFGTAFDCFSERSATESPDISPRARANRERLRRALEAQGFRNYSREWWHYEFADTSAPTHSYDFPVQ